MLFRSIYPRDIIAFFCLSAIFILLYLGYDGWLQGIGAAIIGYYFSKRVYEERTGKEKKILKNFKKNQKKSLKGG